MIKTALALFSLVLFGYMLGLLTVSFDVSVPVAQSVPLTSEPHYWVVLDGFPACIDLGAMWLAEE